MAQSWASGSHSLLWFGTGPGHRGPAPPAAHDEPGTNQTMVHENRPLPAGGRCQPSRAGARHRTPHSGVHRPAASAAHLLRRRHLRRRYL